jgi:subtilisin-like proprotein convertase family protein
MIKNYTVFLLLICSTNTYSQQRALWSKSEPHTYNLSSVDLKQKLYQISDEFSVNNDEKIKIKFPLANGKMVEFYVKENPLMHPSLAKRFPGNRSYSGFSPDDPLMRINFSMNELGLHAMITSQGKDVQYIDPIIEVPGKEIDRYKVYNRSDLSKEDMLMSCYTRVLGNQAKSYGASGKNFDQKLRTYRLALSATGEYAQYHISAAGAEDKSEQEQKALILASMTTALTRINALFENELAIRFQLVENNDDLIFLIPGDPFVQGESKTEVLNMANTNHFVCNSFIGPNGYDIGHVLGTQSIGYGEPSSVCNDSRKGKGVSGSSHPKGDYFYFDMIAHEIGHQFGAKHTFNGNAGNCAGGRNEATAVETGSGSSVMAYAGYCHPQNVQAHSDLYFHSVSLEEIRNFIDESGGGCAPANSIPGNSSPPTADAGEDIFIPVGTAFKLVGKGSDPDGDQLTFSWEQIDPFFNRAPPNGNDRYGALYRSFPPSPDSIRYLPALKNLRNGALSSTWEATPLIDRDFNFSLTVRDNNPEGGLLDIDKLYVEVTDAAGPFVVTSQNVPGLVWDQNSEQTVEWEVAGTDSNGVDVSKVNILLSTDGGLSYPTVLLSNTDNDGFEVVQVPWIKGSDCYIMVEAIENYFFAVNKTPFSIGEGNGVCNDYVSLESPISISDNSIEGVESTIMVSEDLNIEEIRVGVSAEHSYVSDLSIELESPIGTKIVLFHEVCSGNQNIDAVFSSTGESMRCNSAPPAVRGEVQSLEPLNSFAGENARGIWKLKIIDSYPDDVGQLIDWSLNICGFDQVLSAKETELKDFRVYPNPSEGIFTLSFVLKDPNVRIELYDMLGRSVLFKSIESNSLQFSQQIETRGLDKGIYVLKVLNGGFQSTRRVILF